MKINKKGLFKSVFLVTLCLGTLSCKKTFDLAPEDALQHSQAYQNVFDADAALMGLYGKLLGIADRYVVLNELRADLEELTPNSDKYLREINDHSVSIDNPWATPKPYYEIIINCNDVLKNYDSMLADKRLSQTDYNLRYSEVGALRSWLYLQIGIQYGSVPYITDALETIQDVQDESKFPRLTFDQLLDQLISFMEALPNKGLAPAGTSYFTPVDGYFGYLTNKMFINKSIVLGDLYLWKGNYPLASKNFRIVMEYGEILSSTAFTDWYGLNTLGGNGGTPPAAANWQTIFTNDFNERYTNYENIWMLPFDTKFSPVNPFVNLFAPSADKYKIKPSARAIQNWSEQTLNDGTPGDLNRSINGTTAKSYSRFGNNVYAYKIIPNYNTATPFATTGKWILYRAAELHLHFAESANRDARSKLASGLVNTGIRAAYTPRFNPRAPNVTDVMQSFDANPDYYFDARQGDSPNFRRKWSYNPGIRGRVGLRAVVVDSALYFDMSIRGNQNKPVTNQAALTLAIEDMIVNEQALESAFEGQRWQSLLRIALRREKETPGTGKAFLKNKVASKFTAAGLPVPAGVAKLGDDINNWYLPFKF